MQLSCGHFHVNLLHFCIHGNHAFFKRDVLITPRRTDVNNREMRAFVHEMLIVHKWKIQGLRHF